MRKERIVFGDDYRPSSGSWMSHVERTRWWAFVCGREPETWRSDVEETAVSPIEAEKVPRLIECIRYINTYRRKRKPWRWTPCHHIKVTQTDLGGDQAFFELWDHRHKTQESYPFEGCERHNYVVEQVDRNRRLKLSLGKNLVPEDAFRQDFEYFDPVLRIDRPDHFYEKIDVLDRIAMDVMIPELETGFKLPVFLGELLELRPLIKSVERFLKNVENQCATGQAGADVISAVDSFRHKPISEISGAYLGQIFGWLPFVSDLSAIGTKLLTQRDAVTKYLENANKRQTLHFQKALAPGSMDPDWAGNDTYYSIDLHVGVSPYTWLAPVVNTVSLGCKKSVTENLVYHATLDFEYRIENVDSGLTRFLAELDHWGVNFSPSDLWQLVPFSFVVDWIFDVGKWLEQFDELNVPVEVVVNNFCRSVKGTRVSRYEAINVLELLGPGGSYENPHDWSISPSSKTLRSRVQSYCRIPGLPEASTPEYWHLPSGWKLVTSAALLARMRDVW